MWAAFWSNKEQLLSSHVSFVRKLKALKSIVLSAGLFAIEVFPPEYHMINQLDVVYTDICMKTYRKRFDPRLMSWQLWQGAIRGGVKSEVERSGGNFSHCALGRHFRYAGHVARGSRGTLCKALLEFRGCEFIAQQARKHERDRVKCVRGGTQRPVFDKLLVEFFGSQGESFLQIARDRLKCASFEGSFVSYAHRSLKL